MLLFHYLNYSVVLLECHVKKQTQAWRGRKRQARGHHSPPSIQGEWLTIDDQKNNIASLCHLAANWLQKLETKHGLLHKLFLFLCVGVWYLSLIYL